MIYLHVKHILDCNNNIANGYCIINIWQSQCFSPYVWYVASYLALCSWINIIRNVICADVNVRSLTWIRTRHIEFSFRVAFPYIACKSFVHNENQKFHITSRQLLRKCLYLQNEKASLYSLSFCFIALFILFPFISRSSISRITHFTCIFFI